ncbi:hypothetical protein PV08_05817 [Exophiala spinifera]|uniref:AMP-dependent synthetase/ligase domain-containing protein n=1 Tax=Exophiala spinifera TaxID=91928 RepID=A0A0D1ZSG0_9EURO|nr:uncharacterized protein PV08_05817 [Exophiala spinifera]KIW15767.1 hypothetical protein PV08_05817 [Exophiala spinifera]
MDMDESNMDRSQKYSWNDLHQLVEKYAGAFRSSGLIKGDVVALVGSNCVRTLSIFLATASIGAIFSSFATDMGSKGLDDRLQQLKSRFLLAEPTYSYNGKCHNISSKLNTAVGRLQQGGPCEAIILGSNTGFSSNCTSWDTFIARGEGRKLRFEQMPFNAPLVVMFSSGTTGTPKGIVHSHGIRIHQGLVLNGLKEFLMHNSLGPGDLHFHYTNIGWTLWNISIGALFAGATIVLYDGSPFYPTADDCLRLLFKHRITSFGAGPRYFSEIQKLNVVPNFYVRWPRTVRFFPTRDPIATFISWSISCQGSGNGYIVTATDGSPLPDGQGGELVCRNPFPNMPAMFWNDPQRKRYFDAFFAKIPHVWVHGDFIHVDPETKGIYVLGRSDGVLNPSGVRFGSADIYGTLSKPLITSDIADSIVVGQQRVDSKYSDPAERVVLFVKVTPGASVSGSLRLRSDLETSIRSQIAKDFSRRHVPSFVFAAPEIPYNAKGKKLEIQLESVLCGGQAALAKPKLTESEHQIIQWFEKFYDTEEVDGSHPRLDPRCREYGDP